MQQVPRHRVFISYHHDDQAYKEQFARLMEHHIVDKSVCDDDIDDDNLPTGAIRQRIRDEFIGRACVTVVLIGRRTWQRKHVDWEISSSLRDTESNPRCGLAGILLPNHPDVNKAACRRRYMPPRLSDNLDGKDPYARVYAWSQAPRTVSGWIHGAFERREGPPPNNGRKHYAANRTGSWRTGWQLKRTEPTTVPIGWADGRQRRGIATTGAMQP